jgi:Mn2+/Fe2+ NRAMP family transporter
LIQSPPTRLLATLRHLGPGLIITASIVGSGELILTPRLGAMAGFTMLWFIIAGCMIKVFVQIELGRFAIVTGLTTLQALDTVPGLRLRASWLIWLWLVMYAGTLFQIAGIVGGIAHVLSLGGVRISHGVLTCLVAGSCSALLVMGRYRLVAQALMLPFLALAAVYFRHHDPGPLPQRTLFWTIGLWVSALAMVSVGLYQVWDQLR